MKKENKCKNTGKKMNKKLMRKVKVIVTTTMLAMFALTTTAFAATTDANTAWNSVMTFCWDWLPKIGGALCAIGLIEFAFAFKSEDAEGKTRGLRTAVAGAMVIGAVAIVKGLTTDAALTSGESAPAPAVYVEIIDDEKSL